MDMLYSRYSNPLDLMNIYINQGRFGDFVSGFLQEEKNRAVEKVEIYNDLKLWIAYVVSFSKDSFQQFKDKACKPQNGQKTPAGGSDLELDNDGIKSIIDSLFPADNSPRKEGE